MDGEDMPHWKEKLQRQIATLKEKLVSLLEPKTRRRSTREHFLTLRLKQGQEDAYGPEERQGGRHRVNYTVGD